MKLTTFSEVKKTAHAKWREYRNAEKTRKDPLYTDLKKMYWQIKHGKVLVNIVDVIKAAGVHPNQHPKLAICKASNKCVKCQYWQTGRVRFMGKDDRWNDKSGIVDFNDWLPKYQFKDNNTWRSLELEAPVPMIPPKCLPKILTDDHFILWEVDEWKPVPPTDPYLLRRITNNIFAVEAQWDLTPIEKAAMAGRIR